MGRIRKATRGFVRPGDEHTVTQELLYLHGAVLAVGIPLIRFGLAPDWLDVLMVMLYANVLFCGFQVLVTFDDRSEHRRKRRAIAAVVVALSSAGVASVLWLP